MTAKIIPFPRSRMTPALRATLGEPKEDVSVVVNGQSVDLSHVSFNNGSAAPPPAPKMKKEPPSMIVPADLSDLAALEIDPCKARGKFLDSMFDDPEIYFERKWDGERRVGRMLDEIIRITGTRSKTTNGFPEKTFNVPHLSLSWNVEAPIKRARTATGMGWNAVPDMVRLGCVKKLAGTAIDGEMVISQEWIDALVASGQYGGALSRYCTRIMNCDPDKSVARQLEFGWMRWIIFDCLFWKGKDIRLLPWTERRKYAVEAVSLMENPFVTITEAVNTDKRAFLANVLAQPFGEGVIAKHIHQRYGEVNLWAKKKVEIYCDVIITGFEPPKQFSKKTNGVISTTKYYDEGLIGKAKIAQYRDGALWDCGTMSGMSDDDRRDMTHHPENWVGKVALAKANGREPDTGRFRHPQYQHIREDKTPEECVYDPDEC